MFYFKSCSRRRTRTRDLDFLTWSMGGTAVTNQSLPVIFLLRWESTIYQNLFKCHTTPIFNSLDLQDISNNCRCASPIYFLYRCWTRGLGFELPPWGLHVLPRALQTLAFNRGVARGEGSRGSGPTPSRAKEPLLSYFFSYDCVMDSPFLKFFVLFYAYNEYSERHCGIYLRVTCIFGDMSRVEILHSLSRPVSQFGVQ